MRVFVLGLTIVSLAIPLASCATYEQDLARSQRSFDGSEYERALAILRALEPDTGRLATPDRARYAYLRGMTDFRIGYKIDARHWLGVAAAIEQQTPQSIPPESATRLTDALKELNEAVYTSGVESLSNDVTAANTAKSRGTGEDNEVHGDAPAPTPPPVAPPPKADPDAP